MEKRSAGKGGNTNQAQIVKSWARSIYKEFLDVDGKHRIPYINEDVNTVRDKIENIIGYPPATLFDSIQDLCLHKMKTEFYPEFVKQEQYRRAFQTAIRTSSQVLAFSSLNKLYNIFLDYWIRKTKHC
jgi:hypothetical protein